MATLTSTSYRRVLTALSLVVAMASLSTPAWALLATDRVDLKVLVLSADGTEPSFLAWTTALTREGVPFDTIIANSAAPITAATLTSAENHANYEAVVLATGDLIQCGAAGCLSALDTSEWLALNAFQTRFGIRRVTAYAWPNPEFGLNYPFSSGDLSGSVATLTAAGATVFTDLVGPVPMDIGTYGYYAEPVSASTFKTLVAGPVGPGGAASSLVGVYSRPDGFEELVVTADSNAYQMQSLLLSHSLIAWATHNIRLGYSRTYLSMHIDDIFLPDDRWDTVAHVTHEDDGATLPLIRMLPSDVERAKAWQAKTGLQLDFVFNGAGSVDAIDANGSDALTTSLLANKSQFYWINHTYSHPNLDTLTAAQIVTEIKQNFQFANKNKIPVNTTELVTGEHSGLANPNMPIALSQTNIKWIAADNSKQPTPYAIGPATTIPRYPANVYYNVGTKAEQLDEYNWIYFYNCTNTAITTCLSAPATWDQYVASEVGIMIRHLLNNDPRPHFFHQSNLSEDGTMYPVVDGVLARYAQYVKLPIVQPAYREAGQIMQRQLAWQAKSDSVDAYYMNGRVYLSSPIAVQIPVTGYKGGTLYGAERSGWVSLAAGGIKSVVDVTLF